MDASEVIPVWLNRLLPDNEIQRARMFAATAFVLGLVASPVAQFAVSGITSSLQERAAFPMIAAEIESYRRLPAQVQCSTQVANTIAAWNARIEHEQESNRHWYSDYFSTDRWNLLNPIVLECE